MSLIEIMNILLHLFLQLKIFVLFFFFIKLADAFKMNFWAVLFGVA